MNSMRRFLPLLLILASAPAFAQVTVRNGVSAQQVESFLQQMQGALANGGQIPALTPQQQLTLQRGLVMSKIYNCTEQAVGKPRLDAFVNDMRSTGKTIEAYCKSQQSDQALALALGTLKAKANDPVAIAARYCYSEHKVEMEPLLVGYDASEIAKYERWAEEPALAEQEAKPTDICK